MNSQNLNNTKILYYILSIISLFYQLIIFNTINDFIVILIIFFSNLITASYCLNNKNFFEYPISLLMILFSHFINLGGALYLKSFELSLVTENLEMPLYTVMNLAIFNLLLILSHYLYIKNNFTNNIKNFLKDFFIKNELFDIKNINFLYLLSFIALVGRLFYLDFNTIGLDQESGKGLSLFQNLVNGYAFIYVMPIVIFFGVDLFSVSVKKKNYLFFAFFVICVIFISFSRTGRAAIFDPLLLFFLLIFLRFLFNKVKVQGTNFFRFVLILLICFVSINFLENISKNIILEREAKIDRTPLENAKSVLTNIIKNRDFSKYIKQREQEENINFFVENYYKKSIFNRINILLIHDNFSYMKNSLSKSQLANLEDLQINKIISILPQPIINLFTDNFNKNKHQAFTTASYLYAVVDYQYTNLSIGSSLFTLLILFDKWTYLILLFLFIPSFILFDSFYDNKRKYFSPYILIFFYTTRSGVISFMAAPDIYIWIELMFRTIPQSLLLIVILKFFFDRFFLFSK